MPCRWLSSFGRRAWPVFMAAADVATWLAVITRRGAEETWVTVDLATAFLRAARRERFTCTARVLNIGRQLVYAVGRMRSRRRGLADAPHRDVRANAGRARGNGPAAARRDNLRVRAPERHDSHRSFVTESLMTQAPLFDRGRPGACVPGATASGWGSGS